MPLVVGKKAARFTPVGIGQIGVRQTNSGFTHQYIQVVLRKSSRKIMHLNGLEKPKPLPTQTDFKQNGRHFLPFRQSQSPTPEEQDRKSTRLNSSHVRIS